MFCTTLRRRPSLSTLTPLLTSSTNPKLHETNLQTHDLALRTQPPSPPTNPHQRPPTQPFLILTPSRLQDPKTTERITRFSTLTATPAPTLVFLMTTPSDNRDDSGGMQGFMELQTRIQAQFATPPPLLAIPSPQDLLRILESYIGSSSSSPRPAPPAPPPATSRMLTLALLPHVTSTARLLSTHTTNVLSDLCHSLRDVAQLAETERGREVLGEWLGEEGKGVAEFWEGEWFVE